MHLLIDKIYYGRGHFALPVTRNQWPFLQASLIFRSNIVNRTAHMNVINFIHTRAMFYTNKELTPNLNNCCSQTLPEPLA